MLSRVREPYSNGLPTPSAGGCCKVFIQMKIRFTSYNRLSLGRLTVVQVMWCKTANAGLTSDVYVSPYKPAFCTPKGINGCKEARSSANTEPKEMS